MSAARRDLARALKERGGGSIEVNDQWLSLILDRIDLVDEHLVRRLLEYLQRSSEDFQLLAAFDNLVRASKEDLTARVLA